MILHIITIVYTNILKDAKQFFVSVYFYIFFLFFTTFLFFYKQKEISLI